MPKPILVLAIVVAVLVAIAVVYGPLAALTAFAACAVGVVAASVAGLLVLGGGRGR